jgi:hypothetical protein
MTELTPIIGTKKTEITHPPCHPEGRWLDKPNYKLRRFQETKTRIAGIKENIVIAMIAVFYFLLLTYIWFAGPGFVG